MKRRQLAVDVRGTDLVGVEKCETAHTGAAEHLGSIGTYPTRTYYEHMSLCNAGGSLLSVE
jgi:hypothetical protein